MSRIQDPICTVKDPVEHIHCYRGQAPATPERKPLHVGEVWAYSNLSQTSAAIECRDCDVSDAVGDRVASGFPPWTLDQGFLLFVEQNPIHTAVNVVEWIRIYP